MLPFAESWFLPIGGLTLRHTALPRPARAASSQASNTASGGAAMARVTAIVVG
jgi:hypothetical protein